MTHRKLTIMSRLISAAFLPALLFICANGQQKPPGKNEGRAKEAKAPMLKHEYAEVNGQRVHYVTAGQGQVAMFFPAFPERWYDRENKTSMVGPYGPPTSTARA